MFSDDEQFHHDTSVMQQKQPTSPGAFNQTEEEPADLEPPDPQAIWLCGFALLVLMVATRTIEWYWILIYQVATLLWMYKARR